MSSTFRCVVCGQIVTGWHEGEDTCWDCCLANWPELYAREPWYVPPERLIEVPRLEALEERLFPAADFSLSSREPAIPEPAFAFLRREHDAEWKLGLMRYWEPAFWHGAIAFEQEARDDARLGVAAPGDFDPRPFAGGWVDSHSDIPF
jgi:hypothetical protein